MINVLFFAHLKETLDCERLQLDDSEIKTIAQVRQTLAQKGTEWAKSLSSDATLAAVNQTMATDQTAVKAGDEVAFFPPVTGG